MSPRIAIFSEIRIQKVSKCALDILVVTRKIMNTYKYPLISVNVLLFKCLIEKILSIVHSVKMKCSLPKYNLVFFMEIIRLKDSSKKVLGIFANALKAKAFVRDIESIDRIINTLMGEYLYVFFVSILIFPL